MAALALGLGTARPAQAKLVFFDDFSFNGTSKWVLTGSWASTTSSPHFSADCLTDSPAGNYAANSESTATWKFPVNLTSAVAPRLLFWARYQSDVQDYLHVETSIDGTSWVTQTSLSGTQATWKQYELKLPSFAGQPTFYVRFRASTNATVNDDGWYLDDVFFEDGKPSVTIAAPTTGTVWAPGSSQNINFYYDNSYAPVAHSLVVSYSTNGVAYNAVASGLDTITTSQAWTLPNVVTSNAYVRVEVFDLFGTFMSATTTPAFTIGSSAPPDPSGGGAGGAAGAGGEAGAAGGGGTAEQAMAGAGGMPAPGAAGVPAASNGGMPNELPSAGGEPAMGVGGAPATGTGGTLGASAGSATQGGGTGGTPSTALGGATDAATAAGAGASSDDAGGCSCRTAPQASNGAFAALLALLAFGALRRRRQRR